MPDVTVLPCGDAALLLELADLDAVFAVAAAIEAQRTTLQLCDVVPGGRTVLVTVAPGRSLDVLSARLIEVADHAADIRPGNDTDETTIEVTYDGPDLQDVAQLTGLSTDEVISAHTATPWRVGFGGFAPGFAYLVGGDPRLTVARRAESRTIVPAGSVGLAGEFSGIYPRSSPGGWQLIGHTDAPLWDLERRPPALLQVGTMVRFVARW